MPVAAVSLAGVLDLVEADRTAFGTVLADGPAARPAGAPEAAYPEFWPTVSAGVGEGVVNLLLGGHVADVPDRYATTSPSELPGAGVPVLALHGDADDVVPPAFSRTYAARVAEAEYLEVPGTDHFHVLDPAHESWRQVVEWLAPRVGGGGRGL
ncbi:alpha/beta hydrolase family protein [Amycolatopsis sp. NPDC101161]|uniref:alpha/beta hydrolase family protein n=1 Tax=Amycolatopsis sp. NPDC101161 TaxID=3363940 RepID=UPI0038160E71